MTVGEIPDITLGHFNWLKFILNHVDNSIQQHLCLYLATYMNLHQDIAFPSLSTIVRHTRYSKPTIIKHLTELSTAGWLIKTKGNPERHKSNEYGISFPKIIETLVKEVNHPSKAPLPDLVKEVNPNKQLVINNRINQNPSSFSHEKDNSDQTQKSKDPPKKRIYTKTPSPPGFDSLWRLYDRKGNRKASIAAFKKIGLHHQQDLVTTIAEHLHEMDEYGYFDNGNRQYLKDFQRFIRDECWEDKLSDKREAQNESDSNDLYRQHLDRLERETRESAESG